MSAYKDNERGTWFVQFRYTDYTGKRCRGTKRGFKTKKAALQYEADFINRAANNPEGLTMNVLIAAYLDDKKARTKKSTYVNIVSTIKNHITPFLGERKVAEITKADIRDWQNDVKTRKRYGREGKTITPGTMKKISKQLSSLFRYAMKYYDLHTNPLEQIGNIGKFTPRQEFWSEEEFSKFIQCVDEELYYLIFNLLFYSGMRAGELLALSASDFDFKKNTINIDKNIATSTRELTTPKTPYSVRKIYMPASVMALAKDYMDVLMESPERVFQTTQRTLLNRLRKYAKIAGVKEILVHDLRHSHASCLIHHNVPITVISRRLGHANASITLSTYAHMYKDTAESVGEMLERNFQQINVVKVSSVA